MVKRFVTDFNFHSPSLILVSTTEEPKSIAAKVVNLKEQDSLRRLGLARDKEFQTVRKDRDDKTREHNNWINVAPVHLRGDPTFKQTMDGALERMLAQTREREERVLKIYEQHRQEIAVASETTRGLVAKNIDAGKQKQDHVVFNGIAQMAPPRSPADP